MKNINILIGANGAGKTNLISAFTFLSHLSQGKLRRYVEIEGGAECFFHFGSRNTSRMVFDLKVGKNAYHVRFAPNLDNDSLVFDDEHCRQYVFPNPPKKLEALPQKGRKRFCFRRTS